MFERYTEKQNAHDLSSGRAAVSQSVRLREFGKVGWAWRHWPKFRNSNEIIFEPAGSNYENQASGR
jgi:hypothetical protein